MVVGLLLAAGLYLVLARLGTRRLRFRGGDVLGDPDLAFDPAYAWSLVPDALNALTVTAFSAVTGFAFAAVLGLVLALGRRARSRLLSWPFAAFIEFVRSTPLLVQLFFLFFALPELGVTLSPMQTIVLGLGVHYATYCSEAYRAGINSVPKGQWEAATALSLSPAVTWMRVVLPQAIPNVLPALGNFLVAGFKDAPLGSAIQVTGVLFFANTTAGRDFRPVEPYLIIGLCFLLVSIPAAWLVRRLERRIGYERV
ncbi:ectoine/hydroxyectoine ABC transporter permease subunit EhuD [Egicoccus halophilus]|uniref:Ectoine/hydroxyectoine ABC transporter permease subunit EhuD n=1 Tax=Egicoccus halophilus TaxID=1670830 RepID=A0A8J3A5X4_9ACTN|nr:ectoine/hydroxyectoine ABC transporter permease subunit EhuD [Egicoccus halophilus]